MPRRRVSSVAKGIVAARMVDARAQACDVGYDDGVLAACGNSRCCQAADQRVEGRERQYV